MQANELIVKTASHSEHTFLSYHAHKQTIGLRNKQNDRIILRFCRW